MALDVPDHLRGPSIQDQAVCLSARLQRSLGWTVLLLLAAFLTALLNLRFLLGSPDEAIAFAARCGAAAGAGRGAFEGQLRLAEGS